MKISITFFSSSLILKHNNSVLPFPRKLFIQLDLEFQQFPHCPWLIKVTTPMKPLRVSSQLLPLASFLGLTRGLLLCLGGLRGRRLNPCLQFGNFVTYNF